MNPECRTVGAALSDLAVSEAVGFAALALVVVGSLGPWVSTFVGSVSGTSGDGVITIGLAIGAAVLSWASWTRAAILACVIAAAVAGYDAVNISKTVGSSALVHAGWGVYLTCAAAIVAAIAFYRAA